jgi:hypothetical protein
MYLCVFSSLSFFCKNMKHKEEEVEQILSTHERMHVTMNL